MKKIVALTVAMLLPLWVAAQTPTAGAGASFPSAVYQLWAQKYEKAFNKPVSYMPTGSGDGVKKIIAREVAFGGTDSPLSEADLSKHRLVQLPVLVGGIVPIVNLKGISANELRLTGDVLADIFRGDIKVWNDKRIVALNPGVALPNLAITRIVRSEKSGTTEGLTKYLAHVSAEFKQEVGVSSLPTWPTGAAAARAVEGNDGVVKGIRDTQGAIGYLSFDRVLKHGLTAVRLRSGDGQTFVSASEEGFRAAVKASDMLRSGDETSSLMNTSAAAAWPITLTTYVLLDAQPKTASSVATALHFLYWTQLSGDGALRNSGFSPLPSEVQAKFSARLMKVKPQDGQAIAFM
ncbi:phosphate ABC transporter substrate-binding protein PstS [Rhodoferax aquaticus]|uniref:Phosphate-binding protein PstS n=1 Tax=Rhodoferax aquaticus TaxID=2527691 RepID=A0A515EJM1_9BURK|nr:phosphate ABC transporter substrate-binding protein PstS [Rhodoferax aquaticus]QDL52779.1 phosphate ABC transporter substrate-binding protein PstS [Rhodoferax aquaticus]